jgi:hypothetical protein
MMSFPVAFHRLSFVPEGDDVVVGRVDTGSYAVLSADGAQLLEHLAGGMTPDEAATWYETTFAEKVDIEDFLEVVRDLGFVREDGADDDDGAVPQSVRFQRLGRAMFSPPAAVAQAALLVAGGWVTFRHGDLRPEPGHIFFTRSLLLVQLGVTLGQVPLLFLHESFHALAGRRLGLPTRLGISNRLTYIVFETQINGVLSVPRRKRYLPFLAGMLCDCLVIAALNVIADLNRQPGGEPNLFGRLCLCLAFTAVVRLAWQFQLFLRTDLYYVFATALSCHDLHAASKVLLWNRIWRTLRRPGRVVDEHQWTAHDRRVGTWYGPFLILGVATLAAITAFVSLPVVVQYVRTLVSTLVFGLASGATDAVFWDAAVSLSINLGQLVALAWLARRKRQQVPMAPPFTRAAGSTMPWTDI